MQYESYDRVMCVQMYVCVGVGVFVRAYMFVFMYVIFIHTKAYPSRIYS